MNLHKLKKAVMGVLDKKPKPKINKPQPQPQSQSQPKQPSNSKDKSLNKSLIQLSDIEIKYLITLIGKSDFKGSDLQLIYSITAKLQNQLTTKI